MNESKKILVIEDDPDIRTLLNVRLKAAGYAAVFAFDAVTAISTARKENPDLIILDLGLPGGGGYVVMERLRALATLSLTPIIVISAQDAKVHTERAGAAGAYAFLEKPIDSDRLLAALAEVLSD
jgi:DNA-binding response OmpR family regulator